MVYLGEYIEDLESTTSAPPSTLASFPLTFHDRSESPTIFESALGLNERNHKPLTIGGIQEFVRETTWSLIHSLVPSFFRREAERKLYPTSYLDGLRGVAAFIVFIDHFGTNWFDPLRRGYGSTEENYYFVQLPFIRLFFAGRASVSVFFVISGFVLSYKPLKQIRSGKFEALVDTLASSVFRRGLRLYIPVAVGTFLSMLMANAGWYRVLPEASTDALPPAFETFSEHLFCWRDHMIMVSWPFQDVNPNMPYGPPYNGHLWTIPLEYYGSIIVYIIVLGFSRCKSWTRLLLLGFTSLVTLHYGRWDLCLFLNGVVLAEASLMRVAQDDFSHEYSEKRGRFSVFLNSITTSSQWTKFSPTMNYILCTYSLYLLSFAGGSWPEYEPPPGPFHQYLMDWTPAGYRNLWFGYERFWTTIGGILLVFTISNSATLQRPFTSRLAQYLGDISYALYIVHGPILFTVGTWFMDTYGQDPERWGRALVGAAVMNTILCVWVGDIFWRGVDAKSVLFAKWVAEKCWMEG